ncbi:lipopolysaccharide biosynthesis protein [Azohydromonas aeria]|uniref:lipopolysaccharide biosynthesis protein n=1 Tax=Azohydromonas aeria TaxID=2590212 RepID=UPI0012FC6066|nr:oligosaccharide flippase family protein [Azohydromonas aeria]
MSELAASLRMRFQRRPALLLLVANVLAQSLSVLLAPVLTRLYSPAEFGVMGAVAALVMVFMPMTTGRLELAVARAPDEREAVDRLCLCLVVIVAMATLFGALTWWAVRQGQPAGLSVLGAWWYFVPLGLAFSGVYEVLAMEVSRRKLFEALSVSKLNQAVTGVGAQIALGLAGAGPVGLLLGFLLNQGAGIGKLARQLWRRGTQRTLPGVRQLAGIARRERRCMLLGSWSASLGIATRWSLPFVLAVWWDPVVGGYVFLAERLVGRPLLLVSTSLVPVFVSQVGQSLNGDRAGILPAFRRAVAGQAALAAAWAAAVTIAAPWVVAPVFGAAWAAAVPFIQAMAWVIAPTAALSAVSHILQLGERQGLDSVLSVVRAAATAAVVLIGHQQSLGAAPMLQILAAVHLVLGAVTFGIYLHAAIAMSRGARP